MKNILSILQSHPFFKDFPEEDLTLLAGCAQNKVYQKGDIIAKENDPANEFYLIKKGHVAINTVIPNKTDQVIQTIGEGDIFGWSWLFPPYQWMFEAYALDTTHVIALNGKCLREKLESNPVLGYKVMKQFSQMIIERLNATRLQLMDIYG